MPSLSELQAQFAAALRDPALPPPAGMTRRRFGVYRNNVSAALTGTVAAGFPAVRRIVGEGFFAAMARAYVRAEPPTSPLLLDYGATFPDFVAGFEPAASLPYLADVARIERAWREAYHAAEAEPLSVASLGALPEPQLASLTVRLHPAARLVRSRFPAVTVWRMNATNGPVRPVDFSVAEDALILRPGADVEVRIVPPGGAVFVARLAAGATLLSAAEAAGAEDDRFDLAGNLAGLFAAGAVAGLGAG